MSQYGALIESVKEHGVREPLKVWLKGKQWLIADGRHRWLAAVEAGLDVVPCIEIPKDEVLDVILDADNRRHLTKGALAYRAVLLCPKLLPKLKREKEPKSATVADLLIKVR